MSSFAKDMEMASRGWNLWDEIVSRYPDAEGTSYFVFINKDRITLKAAELFSVFRKEKLFQKAVMITDFKTIRCLIPMDETIETEFFSEYDIDCLLKYYSLHKFSDNFYVLSLNKFEQCCLKFEMDMCSLEEVILLGLYRLNSVG